MTTSRRARRTLPALLAILGALFISSGFALMATAGSAQAVVSSCEPHPEYTETTPTWLPGPPEGSGWTQSDQRDKPGTGSDAVYDLRWYVWTDGQRSADNPPAADASGWNDPSGEPQGGPHQNRTPGVPYFVPHGASDGGSWFLYRNVKVRDAVPADKEYKYSRVHPAVVCTVETPHDATATVTPHAPTGCGLPGSFSVSGEYIATPTSPAEGSHATGPVTVTVTALSGHLFADGLATNEFPITIPGYLGECPDETEGPVVVTPSIEFSPACATPAAYLPLPQLARSSADSTVADATHTGPFDLNGVHYAVSGTFAPGQSITVTATPGEGFAFPSGTADPFVRSTTFKTAAECTEVDPPTSTTTTATPTSTPATTTTKAATTTKATTAATSSTTIPSAVHAGLAGDVADLAASRTQQGRTLVLAGALVLLAGGLGMTRRRGADVRS